MIVWVVEGHIASGGSAVLGVFKDYEDALECQKENESKSQFGFDYVSVVEWEVK